MNARARRRQKGNDVDVGALVLQLNAVIARSNADVTLVVAALIATLGATIGVIGDDANLTEFALSTFHRALRDARHDHLSVLQ